MENGRGTFIDNFGAFFTNKSFVSVALDFFQLTIHKISRPKKNTHLKPMFSEVKKLANVYQKTTSLIKITLRK